MANTSSRLLRTVLLQKFPRDQQMLGAEIGVFEGMTSAVLLEAFPQLRLLMVDWWQGCEGAHYITDPGRHLLQAKLVTEAYSDRRIIWVGDSASMGDYVADESLDWVYIDGDHSYEGVRRDLVAWVPKVKVGGWVLGHDYSERTGRVGVYKRGTKIAVDEFVAAHDYKLLVRSRQTYEFCKTCS